MTNKTYLTIDLSSLTDQDAVERPIVRIEEVEGAAALPERLNAGGCEEQEAAARIAELEQRNCILVERAENTDATLQAWQARIAELEARLKEAEEEARILEAAKFLRRALAAEARAEGWRKESESHKARATHLENSRDRYEAEVGRLKLALEQVEWHDNTGNGSKRSLFRQCPWCLKFKRDGLDRNTHAPDCARQAALSGEQPAQEGGEQ